MAVNRHLRAIMYTDIQGYTSMMQKDEEFTLALRTKHREIFEQTTSKFNGEIIQYFADVTSYNFV